MCLPSTRASSASEDTERNQKTIFPGTSHLHKGFGLLVGKEVLRNRAERNCAHGLLCSLNLKERPQGHLTQSSASQPLKARIFVFDKSPKKGNSPVSLIAKALVSVSSDV